MMARPRLRSALLLSLFALAPTVASAAAGSATRAIAPGAALRYDNVTVYNRTGSPVVINVEYIACRGDWFDVPATPLTMGGPKKDIPVYPSARAGGSRGACLIKSVAATFKAGDNAKIQTYTSSGTSYSVFQVAPTADGGYRVYSNQEYGRETAATPGKSPGFDIVNKTSWPVAVALEQVGCLYYDTIKPGEHFRRNTGAVWFTIKANIAADGKEPRTDWDCAKPIAIAVGAALLTAATAGKAAWAGLAAVKGSMGAAALAPLATSNGVWVASMAAGKVMAGTGAGGVIWGAKEIGDALMPNSAGELKGQYAGPDWPFRCDVMPSYEITGGWGPPGVIVQGNDSSFAVGKGSPLTITRTNNCGRNMSK